MAYTEAGKRASEKYRKINIKRIPLDMKIEEYNELKAYCDSIGETVNGFIKKIIKENINNA